MCRSQPLRRSVRAEYSGGTHHRAELIAGAEGRGLSRLTAERCDLPARIPIAEGTESLNIAVAAGVALYEVSRRRS